MRKALATLRNSEEASATGTQLGGERMERKEAREVQGRPLKASKAVIVKSLDLLFDGKLLRGFGKGTEVV